MDAVEEALRRIDAFDGRSTPSALCRADEALAEAADLDRALDAAGAPRPAGRRPDAGQGPAGRRRHADPRRVAAARRRPAEGARRARPRPPARGRRDRRRQDDAAGVRHRGSLREPAHRRHPQPVAPAELAGRLQRRLGGRAGRGPGAAGDGDRRRRLRPHPGGVLRARRAEADVRRDPPAAAARLARPLGGGSARHHGRRRPACSWPSPPARAPRGSAIPRHGPDPACRPPPPQGRRRAAPRRPPDGGRRSAARRRGRGASRRPRTSSPPLFPATPRSPGCRRRRAGLGLDPGDDWVVLAAADHVAALGRGFVEAKLDRMSARRPGIPRVRPARGPRRLPRRPAAPVRPGRRAGPAPRRRRRAHHAAERQPRRSRPRAGWTPTAGPTGIPPGVYTTELQNLTGHPSISLPAGTIGPLPFGVQLTAPRFADAWLLDLAERWEAARPWRRHPPGYAAVRRGRGNLTHRPRPGCRQGVHDRATGRPRPAGGGPVGDVRLRRRHAQPTAAHRARARRLPGGLRRAGAALRASPAPGSTSGAAWGLVRRARGWPGRSRWRPSTRRWRSGRWASSHRSRRRAPPCRSRVGLLGGEEPRTRGARRRGRGPAGDRLRGGPRARVRPPLRTPPRRRAGRRRGRPVRRGDPLPGPGSATSVALDPRRDASQRAGLHPPALAPLGRPGRHRRRDDPPARRDLPALLLLGLLDVAATLAYALASRRGW